MDFHAHLLLSVVLSVVGLLAMFSISGCYFATNRYCLALVQFCLKIIPLIEKEIDKLCSSSSASKISFTGSQHLMVNLLFLVFASTCTAVWVCLSFLWYFAENIFIATLIWRGFNFEEQITIYDKVLIAVQSLDKYLCANTAIVKLFYPVLQVVKHVADVTVDLNSVHVGCGGVQSVVFLFVNVFILLYAIVYLESNLVVLWNTTVRQAQEIIARDTILHRSSCVALVVMAGISAITCNIAFPVLLRYFMGFVRVDRFIIFPTRHGVGDDDQCSSSNSVFVEYDYALSVLITCFGWWLLPPLLYTLSDLLIPGGQQLLNKHQIIPVNASVNSRRRSRMDTLMVESYHLMGVGADGGDATHANPTERDSETLENKPIYDYIAQLSKLAADTLEAYLFTHSHENMSGKYSTRSGKSGHFLDVSEVIFGNAQECLELQNIALSVAVHSSQEITNYVRVALMKGITNYINILDMLSDMDDHDEFFFAAEAEVISAVQVYMAQHPFRGGRGDVTDEEMGSGHVPHTDEEIEGKADKEGDAERKAREDLVPAAQQDPSIIEPRLGVSRDVTEDNHRVAVDGNTTEEDEHIQRLLQLQQTEKLLLEDYNKLNKTRSAEEAISHSSFLSTNPTTTALKDAIKDFHTSKIPSFHKAHSKMLLSMQRESSRRLFRGLQRAESEYSIISLMNHTAEPATWLTSIRAYLSFEYLSLHALYEMVRWFNQLLRLDHKVGTERRSSDAFRRRRGSRSDEFGIPTHGLQAEYLRMMSYCLISYAQLCGLEHKELYETALTGLWCKCDEHLHRCMSAGLWGVTWVLCYICGVGHLLTVIGREHWKLIAWKYGSFLLLCLGVWSNDNFAVEAYNIIKLSKRSLEGQKPLVYQLYIHQRNVSYVVSAVIATRAILLQASTYLTVLSVYAYCTASSPLFVYSEKLQYCLPELFFSNPREIAVEIELEETKSTQLELQAWRVRLRMLYLYFTHSRGIRFAVNNFQFFLAIGTLYGNTSLWVLLSLIVYIPYCAIQSLTFFLNICNRFGIDMTTRHEANLPVAPVTQAALLEVKAATSRAIPGV